MNCRIHSQQYFGLEGEDINARAQKAGLLLPWSDFIKEHGTGLIDVETVISGKREKIPI